MAALEQASALQVCLPVNKRQSCRCRRRRRRVASWLDLDMKSYRGSSSPCVAVTARDPPSVFISSIFRHNHICDLELRHTILVSSCSRSLLTVKRSCPCPSLGHCVTTTGHPPSSPILLQNFPSLRTTQQPIALGVVRYSPVHWRILTIFQIPRKLTIKFVAKLVCGLAGPRWFVRGLGKHSLAES